jgi:hypothetical protein
LVPYLLHAASSVCSMLPLCLDAFLRRALCWFLGLCKFSVTSSLLVSWSL